MAEPPQRGTVWVCGEEGAFPGLKSTTVEVETVSSEVIIQRLLSGERPDGVVFKDAELLQPVRYFVDWTYRLSEKLPESTWTLRLMRGVRQSDRKAQLEAWAASQKHVYLPSEMDVEKLQRMEIAFRHRLETTRIPKIVYQDVDIAEVTADLNRRAVQAGFGPDPILFYEELPDFALRRVTLEVEDKSFLEVIALISDICFRMYSVGYDQVWMIAGGGDGYAFVERSYLVNRDHWENWMQLVQQELDAREQEHTHSLQDPFGLPRVGSELGSKVGAVLPLGPVRRFDYLEEEQRIVAELPYFDFFTLEDVLYRMHTLKKD